MVLGRRFDVILVGAGPAGCVLANRLTEDADRTVLLLEAGPDYGPDPAAWPAELRDPTGIRPDSHQWGYTHAGRSPERALSLPRARVVGGSSTINACFWLRGSDADYDEWAALGNPGWSASDLLPYFRRAENDPIGGDRHGTEGPVRVYRASEAELTSIDRAFVAAAEVIGFPQAADVNGDGVQRPSVGPMPKNICDGMRMNGAFTYLAPVRSRRNLTIEAGALVDRVVIDGARATGVRLADGREFRAREVILCAGAYGSPSILLRSGIGPAEELGSQGIPVAIDLPGVGNNLLDHPFITSRSLTPWTIRPEQQPERAVLPSQMLVKARSRGRPGEIDLHIYHGQRFDTERSDWVFWLAISLMDARSSGRLRLLSRDPTATLHIDHRYLTDAADLDALCDGVEEALRLVAEPTLADLLLKGSGCQPHWRDRAALRAWVTSAVETTFHPSGTCRMGPSGVAGSVVDAGGRVHGLESVRVADASIFPTGPRANLHCTVVAVAEKLADAVRAGP